MSAAASAAVSAACEMAGGCGFQIPWKLIAVAVLVIGGGLGAYSAFRSPQFVLGLVKAVLESLGPALKQLGRRGTPEQEAKAQEDYRRGGTGNIPLPAQREKHGNLIDLLRGKRDAKGKAAENPIQDEKA